VFINNTDDGVVVSVHKSPLSSFIRNSFASNLIISIIIFVFGLTFFLPLTLSLMHDYKIILINKDADIIIMSVLFQVLILIGKIIQSAAGRMKSFHLLLTPKNTVLIYRKNPLKTVLVGQKSQLTITIDYTCKSLWRFRQQYRGVEEDWH
jgi:hypothetical protein